MPLSQPGVSPGSDGWIIDPIPWTRTANTTFTTPGDTTVQFSRGTRIKVTDSTVKYFLVTASSFSSGTTTVTITGGTDYSLAATPTAQYYSYEDAPQGFPVKFSHTPTFTGFSANPTGFASFFQVVGKWVLFNYASSSAGTSNSSTFNITLPIAPALGNYFPIKIKDNGAAGTLPGMAQTSGGSTTLFLYKALDSTGFTTSGSKDADISIMYPMN